MSAGTVLGAPDDAVPSAVQKLNARKLRSLAWQGLFLIGLALLAWLAWRNIQANLAIRNLTLGFGFLGQEAGFGIPFTLVPYSETDSYGRVLLVGILNTLLAAGLSIILATCLGLFIGIARLSPNWAVARAALVYVEAVRNLPLLLHVLIWYNVVIRSLPPVRASASLGDWIFLNNRGLNFFGVTTNASLAGTAGIAGAMAVGGSLAWRAAISHSQRTGRPVPVALLAVVGALALAGVTSIAGQVEFSIDRPRLQGFNFVGGVLIPPELAALVGALTVYNASFIAELVRGSILAVGTGQREAASSLGLTRGQALRLVVIPQAVRLLIPPLTNQYLHLVKASSLATVIGFPDIINVFVGATLNQTGRAIEIMAITMAIYLLISVSVTAACARIGRAHAIVER